MNNESTIDEHNEVHNNTGNKSTGNKSTVVNTIGWSLLGFIFIGLLQLLLMSPLFITGYFSWDITQLSSTEFLEQLDINDLAIFKLFECIATIIIIAALVKRDSKNLEMIGFTSQGFARHGVIAFGLGAGMLITGFILLFTTNYIDFTLNELASVPWLGNIGLFIAVAIGEELLCRGYIQHRLATVIKPMAALIATSACFAVLHLANDNLSLVGIVNIFLAGILFGVYYMHTNNLLFPIVLHFAWNFVQGPVLGFSVSGIKTDSWLTMTASSNPLITGGAFGFEGSILCTILTLSAIFGLHYWLKPNSVLKTTK